MSYDLMVFEVGKAPQDKKAFMEWYDDLTEWAEDISYDDISICCPGLQSWYQEMRETFPPMNGPDAVDDPEDESMTTDYAIARDAIYVCFAWSQAKKAYQLVRSLAAKHGVGFFDVSGAGGDIILPEQR